MIKARDILCYIFFFYCVVVPAFSQETPVEVKKDTPAQEIVPPAEVQPPSEKKEEPVEKADTAPATDQSNTQVESSKEEKENEKQESVDSQNGREFVTFIGGFLSLGMNQITYKDWMNNKQDTKKSNGFCVIPGATLWMVTDRLIGDFSLGLSVNRNSTRDLSVTCMDFKSSLKYYHYVKPKIAVTGGGGVYFEAFSFSKTYDGGGVLVSVGMLYQLNYDWIIFSDLFFRRGYFGMGENSSKISYGVLFGFVKKIGRL